MTPRDGVGGHFPLENEPPPPSPGVILAVLVVVIRIYEKNN